MGEHIRKRRLVLELNQKEAGTRLGVTPQTILHWEEGQTEPPIEHMPAIMRFLGYDPFPAPESLAELLIAKRRTLGWSIKEAVRQLGVDEGTWRAWEGGETILFRSHQVLVAEFLGLTASNRGIKRKRCESAD